MENQIIKTDGTVEIVSPIDGKMFSLKELQGAVEGYIEAVYLSNGMVMFVNEEGKLHGKEFNAKATLIASDVLRSNDCIVGNVIIVSREFVD